MASTREGEECHEDEDLKKYIKIESQKDIVTVAYKRKAMLRAVAKREVEKQLYQKPTPTLVPSPTYYVKGGKLNLGNTAKGNSNSTFFSYHYFYFPPLYKKV